MVATPWNSRIYGDLLADGDAAALFSDEAQLRAMLRFEAALAEAEAEAGCIPAAAAARIAAKAEALPLSPAALAPGTADAGVPVPALVEALRAAVGGEAASYVHWGATSQDVLDTALVLRLGELMALLDARLRRLCTALDSLAEAHRHTVMAGRTRSQQAVPISFGLKAAGWLAPLIRHRQRLAELRPRVMLLSFGGAAGTLAALGAHAAAVEAGLAARLGLGVAPLPWHTQRDGLAELAGWLALVSGSLGKIAQDLVLLGQSEVAEVRPGTGGGSSTMPQKANPVAAEAVVSLARFNAGMAATMYQAMLQEHERSGVGWPLEWLALPQMAVAAAAALRQAEEMLDGLRVDAQRMRETLAASQGLLLAEAASFALSAHMPREEAQALVKSCAQEAARSRRHLMDLLAERTAAPIDWTALKRPDAYLGMACDFIDRARRLHRG